MRSDVWRPQAGDGQSPQAVAETGGDLPVVDDGAADESVAGRGGKPSEAAKVGGSGRGRCLDFDADDAVSAALDDEINLDTVPVAEMEQSVRSRVGARLASQLAVHERFGELTEQLAVLVDVGRTHPEQCAGEPDVSQMQLGCLDDALAAVAVPRAETIDQE